MEPVRVTLPLTLEHFLGRLEFMLPNPKVTRWYRFHFRDLKFLSEGIKLRFRGHLRFWLPLTMVAILSQLTMGMELSPSTMATDRSPLMEQSTLEIFPQFAGENKR